MASRGSCDDISCKVMVIGGGVAGMLAAIEARAQGRQACLLTKGTFTAGDRPGKPRVRKSPVVTEAYPPPKTGMTGA